MSLAENKYFLCVEYKEPLTKKYGKSYISFNQNGLVYDTVYKYSMEQIDAFLALNKKEQILKQVLEDNVLYFLKEIKDIHCINLSIHHYDSKHGKERVSAPLLPEGCYAFDIDTYLLDYLDSNLCKLLHNKLGGYMNNIYTKEETKEFIRMLPYADNQQLWNKYNTLPYLEQRKIKYIIYENVPSEVKLSLQLDLNGLKQRSENQARARFKDAA